MAANKIVTAPEAIALIRDGDTVAVSGFVGIGTPDELIIALAERFRDTQAPSWLTLMFAAAPGDGKERGLNRLADDASHEPLVGGHWSLVPKLGCVSHLYRDIAAGCRPRSCCRGRAPRASARATNGRRRRVARAARRRAG